MNVKPNNKDKPWWNRPIMGSVSLTERLLRAINKEKVPELALSLHNKELEELNEIVSALERQDDGTFKQEFLDYISIKNKVENSQDEYKGLNTCIKILRFAIEKNIHFRNIHKIELDCQGKTQLELYKFVLEQLDGDLDPVIFKENVQEKIEHLVSITRNELIKDVLGSYLNSLNTIAEDEIGLKLLLLFKKYKRADATIFDIISDILKELKKQDLANLKALVLLVKVNYEQLEKIGILIGIPNKSNQAITYAKIFQYIVFCYKYESCYARFQQLLENLIKWEKHYKNLQEVRQQYPIGKYKLPEEFIKIIPGESIYQKYKDYLPIS
jgi:hypothetical protein